MTWWRIDCRAEPVQATLYALGDCKTLLRTSSGAVIDADPFVNPHEAVLHAAIARLRAEGVVDPSQRRQRMLPLLRQRRVFQNGAPRPGVLCLQPNGMFQARMRTLTLDPGTCLLAMTDGFYRLVDPYALHTDAGLVEACEQRGLAAMRDRLRIYEAQTAGTAERAVKAMDDASAALIVVER